MILLKEESFGKHQKDVQSFQIERWTE